MPGPKPSAINLKDVERQGLELLVRRYTTGQQKVIRARIVLLAARGKNQTACGHPTLKDGVCFGPHALTSGFMESRNHRVFVALISVIHKIGTPLSVSPGIP